MSRIELNPTKPFLSKDVHPLLVLAAIVEKRLSGPLRIQSDKATRQFSFVGGHFHSAFSNLKSELPGSFLVKQGKMNPKQFDDYFQAAKTPQSNHWKIALETAGVPPSELDTLMVAWAREVLATAMSSQVREVQFTARPNSDLSIKTAAHGLRFLIWASECCSDEQKLAMSPEFKLESAIIMYEKVEKAFEPLPLDTEERGLLTVVHNSRNVAEVYESSFIGRERISSLLFAFWAAGFVDFESAEQAEIKAHENSLSTEDRELRLKLLAKHRQLEQLTYYDWLDVPLDIEAQALPQRAQALMEFYALPKHERLFMPKEGEVLSRLLTSAAEALSVLSHPVQRKEYDAFLATGHSGSFRDSSQSGKEESILEEAKAASAKGEKERALATYQNALRTFPDSLDVIVAYAQFELQEKAYDDLSRAKEVLKELTRGLSKNPTQAAYYEILGQWLVAVGQKEKAADAFRRAITHSPLSSEIWARLEEVSPGSAARTAVKALHSKLARLSHFELLGIPENVQLSALQAAYRERTKQFHPDRFYSGDDQELKFLSKEVYKRMVDAYVTLKNPRKREEYEKGRNAKTADLPSSAQAKKFLDLAVAAIRQGKWENAKFNLQLGLQVEPQNQFLLTKLAEVERKLP